jgi:hypothetical protein
MTSSKVGEYTNFFKKSFLSLFVIQQFLIFVKQENQQLRT